MKYRPVLLFSGLLLFAAAATLCLIDKDTAIAQVFAIIGIGNIFADMAVRLGHR